MDAITPYIDRAYADLACTQLAEAPVEALRDVSALDAQLLYEAFGITTIRQLAEHRLVRTAQAITALTGPKA